MWNNLFVETTNPESPETDVLHGSPRRLYGTRVILEESPGIMRLSMPCGGISFLTGGAAWIGLTAWGAIELSAGGIPPWILALVSLPGLTAAIVGAFRIGRSISFELGPDNFTASRLGLLARTTKSWSRSEIVAFKTRNTFRVNQSFATTTYMARLLIELRSGKEAILVRQGDGLALGHIAVFLSKALQGSSKAGGAGGGT